MKARLATWMVAGMVATSCDAGHEGRLLHQADRVALVAACRRAMVSLPPPGPEIDPGVYRSDGSDPDFQKRRAVLDSRTVMFDAKGNPSPWVTDPRLPKEVLSLEPQFVAVTPDAVYISLCGAGLSCSGNVVREGMGLEAVSPFKGGQPECTSLHEGLWYCHE
jgi:hypothetical protein